GDGLQPLVALWKVSEARPTVAAALDEGQGAVHLVIRQLQMTLFDISPHRLGNLNTPRDFD
ncbi:MAG: molybdenum cofactor guanylyltransferase, partial [Frankiaceae bacterium]|nr:molybdenum cofactor guanylyltransferase [Arenimonas sp.]